MDKGLELVRKCPHPEAQWFAGLFPADEAPSQQGILRALAQQGDDCRALGVRALILRQPELLLRAAELGFAPAQASLGAGELWALQLEKADWAEKAAAQGNRKGLWSLGRVLEEGKLRSCDPERAVQCFREAAELGCVEAMYDFGRTGCQALDWQRYRWWGRAATRGSGSAAEGLRKAASELEPLRAGRKPLRALAEIGAACSGHLVKQQHTAFGNELTKHQWIGLRRTVTLYNACCDRASRAVECWLALGRRFNVVRDIRRVVAQMLWEERWEWAERPAQRRISEQQGMTIAIQNGT